MKEVLTKQIKKTKLATVKRRCKELFEMICNLDYEGMYKLGKARGNLAISLQEVEVLCDKW